MAQGKEARWKRVGGAAALALLAGHPALAQVTPEEVWQNWQDVTKGYGQTMTAASETRDGDTLTIEGLSIKQNQDGVVVDATIDEVNFTDNGDGTVEITMSDSYPVKMTLPADTQGEGPTNLTIAISQPGVVLTVGGTPTDTSYEFEAPTLGFKLEAINGVDAGAVDVTANVTLTAVTGSYEVTSVEGGKAVDSSFTSQSLALTVVAKDPDTQSDVRVVATIADIESATTGTFVGIDLMATNMAQALRSGFAVDGGFTHGAMSFDLDVTEGGKPTKVTARATGGGMTVAMDESGFVYGLNGTGTAITVSGPEIPFPEAKVTYGEIAFNLAMPMLASDTPSNFSVLTRLVDLAVSEEIWGMIDPTGAVPHDPATVILDTKGTARLTVDLVDEAAMATLGNAPPGELNSLDITELRATVAGAELTGTGALTFDNTDLATFGGMPTPTGKVDLKLVGGNALLDRLVAIGMLTAEDVGGMRMMLSMFANAGAAPDELNSTLEFKDKGFYANGQRLQ